MVNNIYSEQMTLIPPPYRYIIDTCSILSQKADEPHRRSVYSTLWQNIDELVKSSEIVICSEVKDEVEDETLKPWIQQCTVLDVDAGIQQNVVRIVNEHPELFRRCLPHCDRNEVSDCCDYRGKQRLAKENP